MLTFADVAEQFQVDIATVRRWVRRGLLCSRCNTGIGLLDDDVERMAKAIAYLTRAEDQQKREALERLGRAVSG